jgi:tetratricopeptide (TPR) repeat protein
MKYRLRFIYLFCLFFAFPISSKAQLLNDQASLKMIQNSLDNIYNYEFDDAERVITTIEKKYPNHPVNYILDSFVLYWKYLPIKDNPAKSKEYINLLNQCLDAINKKFGKNSKDPEAVFYTMVARGYMAMLYNYRGELMSAAGEGKKAYNALTEGLSLISKNPEFYFTAGMYNYYVEVYPEEHPIVKPLMLFFKNGDKTLGLKQIDTGTRLGTITRAESCYYLSRIYLKHEGKPEKAMVYAQKLVDLYPQNVIYRMNYVESLVLAGRFDQAEPGIEILKKNTAGFYPLAWRTFQGVLLEKGEKDDTAAQKEYLLALRSPMDDQYTKEYQAMSYAGLARIADRAGKKSKAKEYYKRCLEKSEYSLTIKEAKAYNK